MTEHEDIPVEPDRVPPPPLRVSFAIVLAAIGISVLAVWLLAGRVVHGGGRSSIGPGRLWDTAVAPGEPFTMKTGHEIGRAAARARLDSWEWVDRTHSRVRMPIGVAIDRYLEGAR
jgi:hypothetical protein